MQQLRRSGRRESWAGTGAGLWRDQLAQPPSRPAARPARPLKHRTGDKNHSHTPAKMFLFGEKNTIRRKTSDNKMVVGNTDRHNLKRLGLQTAFTFSI